MAANRPGFSYYLLVNHADGDWYEFLAEFGVVGTGLFVLIWIPHLQLWLFRRRLATRELLLPSIAVGLLLYHGLLDQTFRNVGVNFLLLASSVLVSKGALLLPGPSDSAAPIQENKISPRRSRSSSDRSRKRHQSPSES
jgi:O-antigen ligase